MKYAESENMDVNEYTPR